MYSYLKQHWVAVRRSVAVAPETDFSSVLRRPPRCEVTSYTACGVDRPLSDEHYDKIDDSAAVCRPQSGQQYQDIDELIRREPPAVVDQPYLTPVEYSCAGPPTPARRGLPYELIDTTQTDNGHAYASPASPAKPTPTKR